MDIIARRTETPAVPALVAAAAESETLVLGSRGFSGFAGFLVGSVALAVTARAERPVVLVRAGELPEDERMPTSTGHPAEHGSRICRWCSASTSSHPADDLIGYAFDTAAVRSAPLHVVHTWTPCPAPAATRAGGRTAR